MKRIFTALLLLSLVLAACTSTAPQATATAAATPGTNGTSIPTTGNLDGTRWVLESMGTNGEEALPAPGSTVTLEFAGNGQVGGNAGCNTYGGSYETRSSSITFLNVVSTLMACADTAINDQEGAYLQALNSANTYEQTGDRLTIVYGGGSGRLNFIPTK